MQNCIFHFEFLPCAFRPASCRVRRAGLSCHQSSVPNPQSAATAASEVAMPYTLPALPYAFDALEPHIDARTMEIHHGKHHQAYITNVNNALQGSPLLEQPVEKLISNLAAVPESARLLGTAHGICGEYPAGRAHRAGRGREHRTCSRPGRARSGREAAPSSGRSPARTRSPRSSGRSA